MLYTGDCKNYPTWWAKSTLMELEDDVDEMRNDSTDMQDFEQRLKDFIFQIVEDENCWQGFGRETFKYFMSEIDFDELAEKFWEEC